MLGSLRLRLGDEVLKKAVFGGKVEDLLGEIEDLVDGVGFLREKSSGDK